MVTSCCTQAMWLDLYVTALLNQLVLVSPHEHVQLARTGSKCRSKGRLFCQVVMLYVVYCTAACHVTWLCNLAALRTALYRGDSVMQVKPWKSWCWHSGQQ